MKYELVIFSELQYEYDWKSWTYIKYLGMQDHWMDIVL